MKETSFMDSVREKDKKLYAKTISLWSRKAGYLLSAEEATLIISTFSSLLELLIEWQSQGLLDKKVLGAETKKTDVNTYYSS